MHSFVPQLPRCDIESVGDMLQADGNREIAEEFIINEIYYRWPISIIH
jgi:hypothetical protein